MRKTKRVILSTMLVELLFATIWYGLVNIDTLQPDPADPAYRALIDASLGRIMGAFLVLGTLMLIAAVREDRADATGSEKRP